MNLNAYMYKISQMQDKEVRELERFTNEIEKEIINRLNSGLLKANDVNYLKTKLNEIKQLQQAFLSGSTQWTNQAVQKFYLEGAKFATITMDADFVLSKLDINAMNILAQNVFNRFTDVSNLIGRRVDDIYRSVALSNLKGNIIGAESVWQTADKIKQDLIDNGITGFVDKAGKNWNLSTYTEMVGRTSTAEVFRIANENEYLQHDVDLVMITPDIDGSQDSCEACKRWAGRIISLTGKTEGYPTLDEAEADGVFHPNCIHALSYVAADEEELEERSKELDKQLAEKFGG